MRGGHHLHPVAGAVADARFQRRGGALGQKVGLVDDDQVGAGKLVVEQFGQRGFMVKAVVGGALGVDARLVMGKAPFGHRGAIDQRDDPVNGYAGGNLGPVEGAHQRLGQGKARGFDDNVIGRVGPGQQRRDCRHEIFGHRAADAAVRQLDDIVFAAILDPAAGQNAAVNAKVAEFVDDQRDAAPARVGQHVADQCGLAGPKETGDDGRGDLRAHGRMSLWPGRGSLRPRAPKWKEGTRVERPVGDLRYLP